MHQTRIPDWAAQRVLQIRGRAHAYDSIDPAKAALIVVDMQNVFMASGQPAEMQNARDIAPNINLLATEARSAGMKVVWLKHTVTPEAAPVFAVWPGKHNTARFDRMVASCTPGNFGHDINEAMKVHKDDVVLDKTRFSAFIQGSSELHAQLQRFGIDTLVVTGTATNVCVESTARDAMMLSYKVHVVSDATATRTDEEHNTSLAQLSIFFADVRSTAEVLGLVRKVRAQVE
jgi:ureidoacrylate peracid hydrolase